MGPYSHIVIANELESFIKPDNTQDYYWGAIAPDVRYVVKGMPKRQTHILSEKILYYMHKYPQLKNFLQGYLVHCLSDNVPLKHIIQKRFPFNMLKNKFNKENSSMILEFFNIELIKPVYKSISGENNPVLNEFGINDEQATKFIKEINRYISSPSYKSTFKLHQNLGLKKTLRTEKYQTMIQLWQSIRLLKSLTSIVLRLENLNIELANIVKSRISDLFITKKMIHLR